MAPKITYCSTTRSIANAVSALSSQSVLLVDCEAKEIGRPGCVLSLISLSDPLAKHVYLIDVLPFPSSSTASGGPPSSRPPLQRPHPALAPLLALLSLPRITKVFWDGRGRALEFLLTYGLVLNNVLDLQLVDVVARARNVPPGKPAPDLTGPKCYFKSMRTELQRDPAAYAGIYVLRSLLHVIGLFQLVPKGSDDEKLTKEGDTAGVYENGGSELWLARPIPPQLLTYAAHDITLIALVYGYYTRKAWVRKSLPTLCAQSARYVNVLGTREENERLGELGLKRFMPLGIIDGQAEGSEDSRYACARCQIDLGTDSFVKRVESNEGDRSGRMKIERLSFCRLCNALALRNKRPQGEWVDC